MAETKNFLSLTGLQRYDEKIKAFIKSQGKDVTDKLIALIGAAEKGADAKTILDRVADLETAVGNVQNLPGEVKELVAAIVGESTRAQAAEGALGNRLNAIEGEGEGSIKKALAGAKAYADGKDAAIAAAKKAGDDAQRDVDALEAKVGTVAEGKTVVQMISEAQAAATYDDTQVKANIAANKSAIDAVKADYLKASDKTELTSTINANKNILDKGKEDVDTFFADADLTAQAKDTLKEIQEYINSDATAAAEMTASIQNNSSEISALKTKVGALPDGATATDVVGYVDEKVGAEKTRAEGIENGLDTRRVAVEAKLGDGEGSVDAKIEAAKNEAISTAANDATTKADNALNDAKTYVDGKLGNVGEEKGPLTARIKAIEDEIAAAVKLEAISEEQINALFENK